jgi:hypothetical protein
MASTHPTKSYTQSGNKIRQERNLLIQQSPIHNWRQQNPQGDGTYSSNKVLYTIDAGLSINRIAVTIAFGFIKLFYINPNLYVTTN